MNKYHSAASTQIGYKQLVEAIAVLTTDLVEMTDRAEGLDPAEEHRMPVCDFAPTLPGLRLLPKKAFKSYLIRLGQLAGAQGTLAGRPPVVVEFIFTAKCGLRTTKTHKLHAVSSLMRAAQVLNLT